MILCIPIHMVYFKTILDSYYKFQYNISVGSIRYVALFCRFPSPCTILDVGLDQGSSHPFNNCESWRLFLKFKSEFLQNARVRRGQNEVSLSS